MMNAIVLLHRWLGIAFALLFAMWFATGMVMHFVPFPSLGEAERFAGLPPIDGAGMIGPADAVKASGFADAGRIRLIQREDGPVYIVAGRSQIKAVNAADGTDAAVKSRDIARNQAEAYARNRGIIVGAAPTVELSDYDQWIVPNGFDRYRPLFRVTLGDPAGHDIYIASNTGEVVLTTTRHERVWNYAGSVLHWIYPTVLRRDWALWDDVVWNLSLLSAIAALLGAILGIARLRVRQGRLGSPYRGWHALHHVIGLVATIFVMTWIVSGWLSMDHGRLFSRGQLTQTELAVAAPALDQAMMSSSSWAPLSPGAREVEWFRLDGQVFRRDRVAGDRQLLFRAGSVAPAGHSGVLSTGEVGAMTTRLGTGCATPSAIAAEDTYAASSILDGAPVYRAVCGDVWFDVDSASGAVLQRLDMSRRAYRWAYTALHRLDFPVLLRHPLVRTVLILSLCSLGLLFSITGIVIGWRRLRLSV
jgi:PepSY-associated TM region